MVRWRDVEGIRWRGGEVEGWCAGFRLQQLSTNAGGHNVVPFLPYYCCNKEGQFLPYYSSNREGKERHYDPQHWWKVRIGL